MARPFDIPTEVGQRVLARGRSREGTVKWLSGNWCGVRWEDGYGPNVCHVNELQKVEKK